MKKWDTKKMVSLALFLAIGVIFNFTENVLISVPIMPGIKLGLANTIGLLVLYYYGWKEFLIIGILRVLLTALISGFGMATTIALGGWALSSLVVVILYLANRFSIFGLSMISAVMHGLGQIYIVSIWYKTLGMFVLFPILGLSGLISGLLIAFLCRLTIKHLPIRLIGGANV